MKKKKTGGNFQQVFVACEFDWRECSTALIEYIWKEAVTDVADYLSNEIMVWKVRIMNKLISNKLH